MALGMFVWRDSIEVDGFPCEREGLLVFETRDGALIGESAKKTFPGSEQKPSLTDVCNADLICLSAPIIFFPSMGLWTRLSTVGGSSSSAVATSISSLRMRSTTMLGFDAFSAARASTSALESNCTLPAAPMLSCDITVPICGDKK